jgi:hypothetical protein
VYRTLIREKHKEINETIPGCDLDEEKSQIVLRGSAEQVSAAVSCPVAWCVFELSYANHRVCACLSFVFRSRLSLI